MVFSVEKISQACRDAAELLPRQGPITKFAFLNPLMGLEHLHFDKVMEKVGSVYKNDAYLDDVRYRNKLANGRIVVGDLREVIGEDLGVRAQEVVAGLTVRSELRLAMLTNPLHFGNRQELDWVLAETEALKRFRPELDAGAVAGRLDKFKLWSSTNRNQLVSDTF